eukprot:g40379.t1
MFRVRHVLSYAFSTRAVSLIRVSVNTPCSMLHITSSETPQALHKIEKAVRSLRTTRLPVYPLKCRNKVLLLQLHALICLIWKEENIPEELQDEAVVCIFKKGNKSDCACKTLLPNSKSHCIGLLKFVMEHEHLEMKFPDEIPKALFIVVGNISQANLKKVYRQKLKQEDPSQKEIQYWSEAAEQCVRDYLGLVDWTVFKYSVENLDEYPTTVMVFISKCVEDCRPKKSIQSIFLGVIPRKAMGLDRFPRDAIRSCVDQLTEAFTDIFKISLLQAKVPNCFKKITIIP